MLSMPISAVLVGAGQRGRDVYGAWALRNPDRLRFVAVADPEEGRRARFAQAHGIPTSRTFVDDAALFAAGRIADACVIATSDRHHHKSAAAALELDFHVLLEKPMASTLDDTVDLVRRARPSDGSLHVAHVLRFAPLFLKLNGVLQEKRIGDIVSVEHRENVAAWHMAHSYVRGNWARSGLSTSMIVNKCCHDFDILAWNLSSPVSRLTSAGSLFEFRPERAPAGATTRCTDNCPVAGCPYDARRMYLDPTTNGWPVTAITDDLSCAGRLEALHAGPYGRCVYLAGSDVVDQQIVLMELENGVTVALHMHGHSHEEARSMRYDGTRGTLRATFGVRQEIEIIDHATEHIESISFEASDDRHGGGDEGIMDSFVRSVDGGRPSPTDAASSLESHLLAFSAEEARLTGQWIDIASRRRRLRHDAFAQRW